MINNYELGIQDRDRRDYVENVCYSYMLHNYDSVEQIEHVVAYIKYKMPYQIQSNMLLKYMHVISIRMHNM